jgi:hypothetical protein
MLSVDIGHPRRGRLLRSLNVRAWSPLVRLRADLKRRAARRPALRGGPRHAAAHATRYPALRGGPEVSTGTCRGHCDG